MCTRRKKSCFEGFLLPYRELRCNSLYGKKALRANDALLQRKAYVAKAIAPDVENFAGETNFYNIGNQFALW